MGQRRIHFATNRIWDGGAGAFGAGCETPATRMWLGTVNVGTTADPMAIGEVGPPEVSGFDDFQGAAGEHGSAAGVLAAWLGAAAARDAVPLLVVHGFNYRFEEACARAGQLSESYEAAGGIRLEPLAFAWPSDGALSPEAYGRDRQDCAASGPALARLVRQIAAAHAAMGMGRKPAWLAHSMGVHATCCAMQALAAEPGGLPSRLFGQAVLVAGDEEPDVLAPGTGRLRPMLDLADWTTVGVYAEDTTLNLMSGWLQGNGPRLGAGGPDAPPRPEERCFVVDYGKAVSAKPDMVGATDWNDVAHQYYRNDPRVIRDLALALGGDTPPDGIAGRRWGRPDPSIAFSEKAGRLYVV
jgi:esterase/lipase superfamily enzyme